MFEEAKVLDALLVFDEAEGLFGARHAGDQGSAARYANMDVGLLLHHLERFPGALVLITNTIDNIDKVGSLGGRSSVKFWVFLGPAVSVQSVSWVVREVVGLP